MKNIFKGYGRNLFRTIILLLISFAVPFHAYAACSSCYYAGYQSGFAGACTECAAVFRQLEVLINSSTSEIKLDIENSTNSINKNIDDTRQTLSDKIKTATDAIVSALEKQSAGSGQLQQADINYKAASSIAKSGAEAKDMFTEPASDLMNPASSANACATMSTTAATIKAAESASLNARALTAATTRKSLYTTNASADLQKEVKKYAENFCSDKSFERGICTKKAETSMQDADSNAGSLLAPVAGRTYSESEAKSAMQYITNVIGPVQQESLPIAMEKTPGGQRYIVEQRSMAATQSMAAFSLNTIYANNNAEDPSSAAAPGENISIVGLMKKFVEDRFGSATYRDSLATLNETGLLRQIAENMAFQNWMDYYQYLQGERSEGLLATTLAMNSRERSERSLAALRYKATTAK